MRPIDADALLEQIGIDSDGSPGYYGDTWQFINTIENAPTLDMTSEWIPCEERLPSKKGEYLVSATIHFIPDHVDDQSTYEDVKIAFYSMGYGWLDAENVTAWMPLPKPWKGADDAI